MHKKLDKFSSLIIFLFFSMVGNSAVYGSYYKSLWPTWEVNNPISNQVISHQLWQEFLDRNVLTNEEKINLVDYANIDKRDYELLKRYIKNMSEIDIDNFNIALPTKT